VASAGGFEITQQSTVSLGSASAGVAAGGNIGSMYSNPAAAGQFSGLNTESSYTLILPNADVTVTGASPPFSGAVPSSGGNVAVDAVTSAFYGTYQYSKDLWLGIGINSPFGLVTKPENAFYLGSFVGMTTKLLTINTNPTIAYRIAPGITVGAGIQIEWAQAKLQFRNGLGPTDVTQFRGDDWAFGGTAGILLEPAAGTSIGFGYRSQLTHDLNGSLNGGAFNDVPADSKLNLPDIVTLSLRQSIAPDMRLLGTVEWTNWSRFKEIAIPTPLGTLAEQANWNDGWLFSVGGEYDYSPLLTLRSGVAYEISPIDDPTKRLLQIPDNNRVWLSVGASYKCSFCESLLHTSETTLDIGYAHAFVQDGSFDNRTNPTSQYAFSGQVNNAYFDLISVGLRSHW
jgi:long-chain fatty acid transport protein